MSTAKITVASFRTKVIPCPGYTVQEQNQHGSKRIVLSASYKSLKLEICNRQKYVNSNTMQ